MQKICVVTTSLGKGGAERSSALLSKMLDKLGYNVHIVSVLNDIDYEYEGTLLNLGEIKDKKNNPLGRFERFLIFKNFLKSEKFDVIIDNRIRSKIIQEYLINRILYKKTKVIYVVRSRNFNQYFTKSMFWAKRIFKNSHTYVGVSEDITRAIKSLCHFKNIITINNPVEFEHNNLLSQNSIDFKEEFILFYGRLDEKVKNISLLLKAYKTSELPKKNIHLLILGGGQDLQLLKNKAKTDTIVFKSFTNNPFPFVKRAKFCCLTSKYEGYPRVLIESLSVNTPVVSVNCSGANEIVKNEVNGLLVENNNHQALAEAMNRLIF